METQTGVEINLLIPNDFVTQFLEGHITLRPDQKSTLTAELNPFDPIHREGIRLGAERLWTDKHLNSSIKSFCALASKHSERLDQITAESSFDLQEFDVLLSFSTTMEKNTKEMFSQLIQKKDELSDSNLQKLLPLNPSGYKQEEVEEKRDKVISAFRDLESTIKKVDQYVERNPELDTPTDLLHQLTELYIAANDIDSSDEEYIEQLIAAILLERLSQ